MNEKIFEYINKGAFSFFLICAAIALLSFAMPTSEKKDYAYIEFDGGYTALGYVSGIKYEMDASLKDDEGTVYASGANSVRETLESFDPGSTVKDGIYLEFDNAYVYSGSVTTFTLTINTSKTYSDGTTAPETWLALMDATEADEKSNYRREAESVLDYQAEPGGENPLAFVSNLFN